MDIFQSFLRGYWIIGYFMIIVLGVILGFGKKIIVFRDYADLGFVFLMALLPVGLILLFRKFLAFDSNQMKIIYYSIFALELLLTYVILSRLIEITVMYSRYMAILTKYHWVLYSYLPCKLYHT